MRDSEVPQTISDDDWWRIQKGAARVIPAVDGPWVDPHAAKTKRLWHEARNKKESN
jgi:hypothetical protein